MSNRADWYGISNLAADNRAADNRAADNRAADTKTDTDSDTDTDDGPGEVVGARGPRLAGPVPQAWRSLHLATWRQRALAWLADVLIWLALSAPGGVIIGLAKLGRGFGGDAGVALGVLLLAGAGVVALWQAGWRQGRQGQSWGKQLLGLYVVRASDGQLLGGPLGLARCLGRGVLCLTVVFQVPSYLWPLRDAKRQTWEDKVVSSVVTAGR